MSRPPKDYVEVHKAADYYEPLMRSKITAGLKALRKKITLQHIVASMQSRAAVIPRKQIEDALQPAAKVIRDAVMHGGKLGEAKVNEVLK